MTSDEEWMAKRLAKLARDPRYAAVLGGKGTPVLTAPKKPCGCDDCNHGDCGEGKAQNPTTAKE